MRGAAGAGEAALDEVPDDGQAGFCVRGSVVDSWQDVAVHVHSVGEELLAVGLGSEEEIEHVRCCRMLLGLLLLFGQGLFLFFDAVAIAVPVAVAVVAVAAGFEVDAVEDEGEVGQVAVGGGMADLGDVAFVDLPGADDVEAGVGAVCDDAGVGEDGQRWGVDEDDVVAVAKAFDEFAEAGLAEQGDGVGDGGAGVEDVDALQGGVGQMVDDGHGVVFLVEQEGGESFAPFAAQAPGEGEFAQVGVDEQDAPPGFGKGEGEVGDAGGFAFAGHGGGEHVDAAAGWVAGDEGVCVMPQDVEAFGGDGVGVPDEEVGGVAFFAGELGEFADDGLLCDAGEVMLGVDFVVEHADADDG